MHELSRSARRETEAADRGLDDELRRSLCLVPRQREAYAPREPDRCIMHGMPCTPPGFPGDDRTGLLFVPLHAAVQARKGRPRVPRREAGVRGLPRGPCVRPVWTRARALRPVSRDRRDPGTRRSCRVRELPCRRARPRRQAFVRLVPRGRNEDGTRRPRAVRAMPRRALRNDCTADDLRELPCPGEQNSARCHGHGLRDLSSPPRPRRQGAATCLRDMPHAT